MRREDCPKIQIKTAVNLNRRQFEPSNLGSHQSKVLEQLAAELKEWLLNPGCDVATVQILALTK